MKPLRLLAATAALLASTACAALGVPDAIAEKIARDRERLRSCDGVIVERGTVPGDPAALVKSRVRFRAPGDVLAVVLEPEAYRGDVLACVGSTVHAYSQRLGAGVRLRNVPGTDPARVRAALEETTRFDLATYGYREGDVASVASRAAIPWTVTPREETHLGGVAQLWMDADLSIPLRCVLRTRAGDADLYEMTTESLHVNEAEPDLSWTPPPEAAFQDWDLAGPALSTAEARAAADFALLEPRGDAGGLVLGKILRASPKLVPVLACVYEKGPWWASLGQTKDRGLVDGKALGVPVDLDGASGRLSFFGDACVVRFVRDGVEATLFTSLPPALAIRFARSLRAGER